MPDMLLPLKASAIISLRVPVPKPANLSSMASSASKLNVRQTCLQLLLPEHWRPQNLLLQLVSAQLTAAESWPCARSVLHPEADRKQRVASHESLHDWMARYLSEALEEYLSC